MYGSMNESSGYSSMANNGKKSIFEIKLGRIYDNDAVGEIQHEREGLEPPFHSITRTHGLIQSIVNTTSSSMNGIMLVLPYMFIHSGLIGGIILSLAVIGLSTMSLQYLHECSRVVHAISYTEIVRKLLGEQYRMIFSTMLFSVLLSLLIGFASLVGTTATQIVVNTLAVTGYMEEAHDVQNSSNSFKTLETLLLLLLLLPIAPILFSCRVPPSIYYCLIIGAMSFPFLLIVLITFTATKSMKDNVFLIPNIFPQSTLAFIEALSLSLPIVMNHFNFLGMCSQLHHPTRRRIHHVMFWSQAVLLGISVSIGTVGLFYLQGVPVRLFCEHNILQALPCLNGKRSMLISVLLVRMMVLISLLSNIPTLLLPTRCLLEDVFISLRKQTHNWNARYVMQIVGKSIHKRRPILEKTKKSQTECQSVLQLPSRLKYANQAKGPFPRPSAHHKKLSGKQKDHREQRKSNLIEEESLDYFPHEDVEENEEGCIFRRVGDGEEEKGHRSHSYHPLFIDAQHGELFEMMASSSNAHNQSSTAYGSRSNVFGFAGVETLWTRYEHGGELPESRLVKVFSRMSLDSAVEEEEEGRGEEHSSIFKSSLGEEDIEDHADRTSCNIKHEAHEQDHNNSTIEYTDNLQRKSVRRVCLSCLLISIMLLGSVAIDSKVFLVWECMGCLLCPWIILIIPCACYMKMSLMKAHFEGNPHLGIVTWKVTVAFIVSLVGFCIFVTCSFRIGLKVVNNQ